MVRRAEGTGPALAGWLAGSLLRLAKRLPHSLFTAGAAPSPRGGARLQAIRG
jgi:hypothetical protein